MRRVLLCAALLIAACGDDGPNAAACDRWDDLLGRGSGVSDAEAIRELRQIEADATGDVLQFASALRNRLEDGADISRSMEQLTGACH